MYESYFHFDQLPFENTPDPTFFYGSEQHREALAALVYGVRQFKGFMLVTGDVGTGKTLLAQSLKHELDNTEEISKTIVIQISNPWISHSELFQELAYRLGIRDHQDYSTIEAQKVIQRELLTVFEEKGRVILILDEAQQIPEKTLEGVRLLSNMEVPQAKLVQIILLGQTEFNDILTRHSMRQLRQRVTLSRRLEPLGLDDTIGYIDHRIHIAGAEENPFTRAAVQAVYEASGGSPRLINQICDNSLITAFASKSRKIDRLVVSEVVADLPIIVMATKPEQSTHQTANIDLAADSPPKQETLLQRLANERGINNQTPELQEEPSPAVEPPPRAQTAPDLNLIAQQALLNAVNESTQAQVASVKQSHERASKRNMPQWLAYLSISLVSVLVGLGATFFFLQSQAKSQEPPQAAAQTSQPPVQTQQTAAPPSQAMPKEAMPPQAPPQEVADNGYTRVYQDPIERFKDLDSPKAFKEAFNDSETANLPATKVEEIRKRWGFDSRPAPTNTRNTQPQEAMKDTDRYHQQTMHSGSPQPMMNSGANAANKAMATSMLSSPVNTLMQMDQPYLPLTYGSTISQVARSKYSTWNDTVRDIVILANPSLKGNLSNGKVNQRIYLPNIHKDDLLTRADNGAWYVYAGTYESMNRANRIVQHLASIGFNAFMQEQPRYEFVVYRLFIGPFTSIREASMATDSLQLDAMPFVR